MSEGRERVGGSRLEICTFLMPQYFLAIGSLANMMKVCPSPSDLYLPLICTFLMPPYFLAIGSLSNMMKVCPSPSALLVG
jgi:hypothetical protein